MLVVVLVLLALIGLAVSGSIGKSDLEMRQDRQAKDWKALRKIEKQIKKKH